MTTPPRLTLGRLARDSGLARASLLHYEALGLLLPAARSAAGYRLYGSAELERLRSIRRLRDAGLPLHAIRQLLAAPRGTATPAALLEARLLALHAEAERLREQQQALARLLALPEFHRPQAARSKAQWVALLRRAGFDDAAMQRWHERFEAEQPEQHAAFLRALGLPPGALARLRAASRR